MSRYCPVPMCGRFVSSSSPERIAEYFGAESNVETLGENFNVAPTNDIYGVVEQPDGTLEVQVFHWGLIPVWAKERKIGQRMINARSETIAEKAAFKGDFKKHRCIIPMDGFYEWAQGVEGGPVTKAGKPAKRPHFIHRVDGEPLAVAGLWSAWKDKSEGPDAPWLHSATVVTTSANGDDVGDPRSDASDPAQGDVAPLARPGQPEHRDALEAARSCTRHLVDDARGVDRGQQRPEQGCRVDRAARERQPGDAARLITSIGGAASADDVLGVPCRPEGGAELAGGRLERLRIDRRRGVGERELDMSLVGTTWMWACGTS